MLQILKAREAKLAIRKRALSMETNPQRGLHSRSSAALGLAQSTAAARPSIQQPVAAARNALQLARIPTRGCLPDTPLAVYRIPTADIFVCFCKDRCKFLFHLNANYSPLEFLPLLRIMDTWHSALSYICIAQVAVEAQVEGASAAAGPHLAQRPP